mmetsp:Transcript_6594/g.14301  ORF Transcript_6594/g.14301 Transcript_6594/m.14301 type:complete len:184 (+) Transcript_6594:245-796(+)
MDLTPRKETNPWWTLLRCCNPSELHKENEGDEKTSTMSASTSTTTECSDDSSELVIEKAVTAKQRVSFTPPVETDAIIIKDTTENTNAEPTLIDSDDDDDDDDDGDASTLSTDSKNPHALKNSDYYSLPFRTFLFYMVLRNLIGVDYLSDRVFSRRKKALMITSGVSSPHGKTKQGEVVAGSD